MHRPPTVLVMPLLAVLGAGLGTDGRAQTPSHVHYAEPAEKFDAPSPTGALAPRLQNLGSHAFPVSTTSSQAQLFINQGLNLAYGFNHAEGGRAFREAARLDPRCAMAFWGQALVLGPNINSAMEGDYLLLCSDGLWEIVRDEQKMAQIILDSSSTEQACRALVGAANQAGGEDNIGVVVVKIT